MYNDTNKYKQGIVLQYTNIQSREGGGGGE